MQELNKRIEEYIRFDEQYQKNDLDDADAVDIMRLAQRQLTTTQQALDSAVERIAELENAATVNFNDRMKINQSLMAENERLGEEIARYKRSSKDRREMIKSNNPEESADELYQEIVNMFNNFDLLDASHIEGGDVVYHNELLRRLKAALASIKE